MEPSTTPRMPAVFFGHGSPMNALETNRYTEAWRAFPKAGVPVAQLAINARRPAAKLPDPGVVPAEDTSA